MKYWLAFSALLISCSPPKGPHRPTTVVAQGEVGFDQVKPVFAKNCAGCHPSRSGPDWLNYDQAKRFALSGKLHQRVVSDRSMPPPQSAEAASIDEKDRQLINAWIQAGAPMTAASRGGPPQSSQQDLIQSCLQCHGVAGPGSEAEPRIPRLTGQNEDYLVWQLRRFKWRDRIDPTDKMNEIALALSDKQILLVSRYFATHPGSPWPGTNVVPDHKRPLYARGEKLAQGRCNSCHMNLAKSGQTSGPWLPLLRGQSKIYLLNQLISFRNKERSSPLMYEMLKDLTDQDIEAVASYYSWSAP